MHTPPPNPSRPRRDRSRWRRLVLFLTLVGMLGGCRAITRNPYDKIEAELRTRERELAETRAELDNARLLNDAYARTPRATNPDDCRTPFLPVKDIQLATGTGGADNDGRPGDEALQVVIVPRDGDNSAIKLPANVTVFAYEIARNGTKAAIGRWDVAPDTLRRTWKSGLFSTGYFLTLQWDQPPVYERVRIQVRMQTLDGRVFEADRDITVRVIPGVGASTETCPAPVIPAPMLDVLPLPRESRSERPVTLAPARTDR
jgi:hypothetical protein